MNKEQDKALEVARVASLAIGTAVRRMTWIGVAWLLIASATGGTLLWAATRSHDQQMEMIRLQHETLRAIYKRCD